MTRGWVSILHSPRTAPDLTSPSAAAINTYLLRDGVEPEKGLSEMDFSWRQSQEKSEEHMAAIASAIARVKLDIVNRRFDPC